MLKQQLIYTPNIISTLVLLSGEDAPTMGVFEETVVVLLLHPLAGPLEQCLSDEPIFL